MVNKLIFDEAVNSSGKIDLILDRDGVLNADTGYSFKFASFRLNSCLIDVLAKHKPNIRSLHIATNQSGIGRGYYTQEQFLYNSNLLRNYLYQKSIRLNSIFFCPHLPDDECYCRKPRHGLLEDIKKTFLLDEKKTLFVGDKFSDEECARRASVRFRYIRFA